MDDDKKPVIRKPRPSVLKKLNTEHLLVIERGLLGDLPDRLKPNYISGPVRGTSDELLVSKPSGFLAGCLPVIPDSPTSENLPSDDENQVSPLKKSFSFRDKFSRISFLGKSKHDKLKSKTIDEDNRSDKILVEDESRKYGKVDHELKSNKRFWVFRNKEIENRTSRPAYKRSKSFEFLPRAAEESEKEKEKEKGKSKNKFKNSLSAVFSPGSNESMGEAWGSNESLEYISNVYYDNDKSVNLKSIRELSPDSSKHNSSLSTVTSGSSNGGGIVLDIFERQSVQNLLEEFNKAVDLFSETYMSDCEPYTKSTKEELREKRKSSSFSTLPSPKVIHVNKVSEASEDFKNELSEILSVKRACVEKCKSARRGSLTDFFLLEDKAVSAKVSVTASASEQNKYRRAQKKPKNRVRRISSTKYVSTILYYFEVNCTCSIKYLRYFLARVFVR